MQELLFRKLFFFLAKGWPTKGCVRGLKRFQYFVTESLPRFIHIHLKSSKSRLSKHDENASLNKKLIEISTKKKAYKRY